MVGFVTLRWNKVIAYVDVVLHRAFALGKSSNGKKDILTASTSTQPRRFLRKTLVAFSAALMGAATIAAPANANERNMVIFGDSIVADPPAGAYLAGRLGSSNSSLSSDNATAGTFRPECVTSNTSFAEQAARLLGLPARNYSCAGTVSISNGVNIASQVDAAVRNRALNPATARVLVSTGFNDTYNNNNLSDGAIRSRYVAHMAPLINRIRAAAPNARIQIVGYPTLASGGNVCPFHMFPNTQVGIPLGDVVKWENQAQWMNVDLARATGTQFLDLKPATRNNGMCALDGQRYWAGLIDFHAGSGNLPIHVNDRGHRAIAGIIARS